ERDREADDVALASVDLRLHLLRGEIAAVAIVTGRQLLALLLLAHLLQALRRAETAVSVTALDELLGDLLVLVPPLALDVGAIRAANVRSLVPVETEPAQALHQVIGRALDESLAVGVLDAEDDLAGLALTRGLPVGEEHVVHHQAGAADVEGAGRRRGEANAHLVDVRGDADSGVSLLGIRLGHAGVVLSSWL